MALVVSITGYVPPANVPLTMAALRKLASGFTVQISGTVSGGEVVDGSITPAKVAPGAYFYGAATYNAGTNTYSVTLTPPLAGLADGVRLYFKAPTANSGASETNLIVNGLPSARIRKRLTETLYAGEVPANGIVEVVYNSTATAHWQLQSQTLHARRDYSLTSGTVSSNRCTAFTVDPGSSFTDITQVTARLFVCRMHADCNANPTMTVGSVTKTLKWLEGRSIVQNQLRRGQSLGFVYDSALDAFVIIGEQPNGTWGAVASGSATSIVVTIPGYPSDPVIGAKLVVKVPDANTGAVTLSLDNPVTGLTIHSGTPVKKFGGAALVANDYKAGSVVMLVFDGTNWQLVTPTCQPVVLAMANFDGSLTSPITPRMAYNIDAVNKVVKNGTGDYTVNFASNVAAAYQVHVTCGAGSGNPSSQGFVWDPATNQNVGSVRIRTGSASTGTLADFPYVYVTVIGYP